MRKWLLLLLGVVGAAVFWRGEGEPVGAVLVSVVEDSSGYARAEGVREFSFPEDFGPHPDFQTEWWYYTGNLETAEGDHFGFQLTFFRRALVPPAERGPARASEWAFDQVYLAHFALTAAGGPGSAAGFQAFERFSRGAAGLAGAQAAPYRVWLEDWEVAEGPEGSVRLAARQGGVAVNLVLRDVKGPVLQGNQGYSQKGPEAGNASYYYSQTRLESTGTVTVNGEAFEVAGLAWMDHEFSTSALAEGQIGWDWFSMQLADGGELMVFYLRRADGSVDRFSSGTVIATDGSTRALRREDFTITVDDTWRSPDTQAVYPAAWTVVVASEGLRLSVRPYLAGQELRVSYAYWEGAVEISGERAGVAVNGWGYVELTGYAGAFDRDF